MKNQAVAYRTVSDDLILTVGLLPRNCVKVLCQLLKEIDIKDNCVQRKWSDVVKDIGIDVSDAYKARKRLEEEDLIRTVLDIRGDERLMLNPQHVWSTSRDLLRFAILVYDLGSHEDAIEHRKNEKETCSTIDHRTGLMTSEYQIGLDRLKQLEDAYEECIRNQSK